jgi:hypothetical protein
MQILRLTLPAKNCGRQRATGQRLGKIKEKCALLQSMDAFMRLFLVQRPFAARPFATQMWIPKMEYAKERTQALKRLR